MIMPSFNKSMIVVTLCAISLFLSFPAKSAADYRAHYCSNTTTYTPNSTYQSNLNLLLTSLTSNASLGGVFHNDTVGRDTDEAAYGSIMCRGDLTPQECQTCVATASRQLVETRCPVEKVAIMWFDECVVRYSNVSFFGVRNEWPRTYLWNTQNVSDPKGTFSQLVGETMRDVAAAAAASSNRFAVLGRNFSDFQSLYSTAQCTPDIPPLDCSMCLSTAIGILPSCCDWKQGGRVLFPSCNVRFELYPFYNVTGAASPTPPASPPPIPPPPPPSAIGSEGNGNISPTTLVAIIVPIVVVLLLISIGCYYVKRKRRGIYNAVNSDQSGVNDIMTAESLQYDLGTIQAATNNFSDDNKLGEGGFGAVYKGRLSSGQEIAVKRLSRTSLQGVGEFKNEVVLVAKLQHRNLTRLLGFCLEGEEKLLVYEFVPNKSLDQLLFDSNSGQAPLDWSKRYKIIGGIARGLLYLHEDSRLRIIHRDMKASNILLDEQMHPKISDFGLAKICGVDETNGNTSRIVGTYGYMAPEYAFYGRFSVKSDVFSFGILIIEIVTGKKSTRFSDSESDVVDLLSFAWKHWSDGTPLNLLDLRLRDSYSANEVARCIHIGLLCVQEDPAERPTMATVVLMLSSFSVSLPLPKQPAFFPHTRTLESLPRMEIESDNSSSNKSFTVNEMSISETYPR